ncbi:MAG: nitroreductase family protein [Clostridiaceae bacterium]|jgi:nitroreductase|nr:nitroreductase family protein [Oscillospiraceae bacterium]NLN47478.1 nitroreductase family protein [Clostridiaceae bacterium]
MSKYPVFDVILARRSIRKYQKRPVERRLIDQLLKAAMAAPSACNLQPWAFIVVDEPEVLIRVKEAAEQGKYNAPLAIVVCGINKHIPWAGDSWMQDCGAAVQNMLLAGTELGLGSVWIGGFDSQALRSALDIPDDVAPMCIIEFGYPADEREPLTWYTEEAVHWQKYDSQKPRIMRTMQMLQDDIDSGII